MNLSSNVNTQLNTLIELARDIGFEIRKENLSGAGGRSLCVDGTKCLQLDTSVEVEQQIATVTQALEADPQLALYEISDVQETALRAA